MNPCYYNVSSPPPCLLRRSGGEKYTSVRMVELKFLSKFLKALPPEVNSCHCIRSFYITDVESKLLNDINLRHADAYFGKEQFIAHKDLVVRLSDAKEFYREGRRKIRPTETSSKTLEVVLSLLRLYLIEFWTEGFTDSKPFLDIEGLILKRI